MRYLLALAVLVVVVLVGTLPAYAAVSPPVNVLEAYAYQHVLETDDMLVLARYNLDADGTTGDGDWDDYSRTDAFVKLVSSTGSILAIAYPPKLSHGLAGFYYAAADKPLTFGDAGAAVRLEGSPTQFDTVVPDNKGIVWKVTTSATSTAIVLRGDLLTMMLNLETQSASAGTFAYAPGELVAGGYITVTGMNLAQQAFPQIVNVVPLAFIFATDRLTVAFDPADSSFQSDLDIENTSSVIVINAQNLSSQLGLPSNTIGIIAFLALGLFTTWLLAQYLKESGEGLEGEARVLPISAVPVFLVLGAAAGFYGVAGVIVLASVCFIIGAAWVWKIIPG